MSLTGPSDDLQGLFTRLSAAYDVVSKGPMDNQTPLLNLREAASQFFKATQTPQEAARTFAMQNAVHPCYRAAADCGVLAELTKGPTPISAEQLAERTGAEQRLIVRIMRVLTGSGVCEEVGEEKYSHNTTSQLLANPNHIQHAKFLSPAIARLPEYLYATSYQNPGSDPLSSTPFQFGNSTPLDFYQALGTNSSVRNAFDAIMRGRVITERSKYKTGFASIFDFEGEVGPLIKSPSDVALVDVGGSRGHVLEDVLKHLPGLKGRLILQDLPAGLKSVELPENIELMPYNFFESEQPVEGAACYLFRQIFLNWNDAKALQILRNTHKALKVRHSRLLIMEPVLAPTNVPITEALLDIQMSQMGGGLRTQREWRHLLLEAGFEPYRFLPSNSEQTIIVAFRRGPLIWR